MKEKKITWNHIFHRLKPTWPPNIFGKKKLLLAFEFGVILRDAAESLDVRVTPEMVIKAEDLLLNECRTGTAEKFACNMTMYTLAVLQPPVDNK